VKIEQRRVQGLEGGPQVEKTALLASPIYMGRPRGRRKKIKRGAKIGMGGGGSLLFTSFGSACPHTSRMYFPLLSK